MSTTTATRTIASTAQVAMSEDGQVSVFYPWPNRMGGTLEIRGGETFDIRTAGHFSACRVVSGHPGLTGYVATHHYTLPADSTMTTDQAKLAWLLSWLWEDRQEEWTECE